MSVWREVQEAAYERFVAGWASTPGETVTPIQLGNETFDPPSPPAPWCKVLVTARPGGPGTIGAPGNRKMDRAGTVFILLREPPGNGVGNLSDLAERARAVFENCRLPVHGMRFADVDIGDEADVDNGRWWGVTVEARFDYEELK